jgi:signal transduction histidine kinase
LVSFIARSFSEDRMIGKFRLVWFGLAAATLSIASLLQTRFSHDVEVAHKHFVEVHHDKAMGDAAKTNEAITEIYQNLRLLAALPGVRQVERHGENLTEETRVTIQQIYDNLAENVSISEVYLIPINFDPVHIDAATQKPESPIASFDNRIVDPASRMTSANTGSVNRKILPADGSKVPEVEDFEYAQMVEQANWFKANYPTAEKMDERGVPFVSSPELILCDNTRYIITGKEADRSGMVFSVPFYQQDGKLAGMVSGMILTNALKALLPSSNLALVNQGYHYSNFATGSEAVTAAFELLQNGKIPGELAYSEMLPLAQKDERSPWQLWAGATNAEFKENREYVDAIDERRNSFLILCAGLMATAGLLALVRRNLLQTRGLWRSQIRARKIANRSEAAAKESALKLQTLNDDISKLNNELADRFKQLSLAQDQIIQSGKMAQLGQLVATVAHEIRNPLGGIRTTLFTLRRKCADAGIDAEGQFTRIETGIFRCDDIITQLLDFSRAQAIQADKHDIVAWLRNTLGEFAEATPHTLSFKLYIGDDRLDVPFDAERLRRAVINLVGNAREALLSKKMVVGRAPVIEVELRRSHRGVEIEVRDNGPGIPAGEMAKVGEPFFTSKSFGSGLGVAAAKQVATLHGGGLEFTSAEGQGAAFTLWLPMERKRAINAA